MAEEIDWHPQFMKVRLEDWINSLQWDWVISRQRFFATPIPIWECKTCGTVVPALESECYVDPTVDKPPVDRCPKCGGELVGCQDVFDTWMDSSISPLFNTFWGRDEKLFSKLFPMSLRTQSHDIIRTWAFYTMIRSHLITGQKPWDNIMIHGFIMSPDGTPMHSSLGNVIDPMPILEEYGADAMRYYACTCALGEDNAFREKDVIHGKRLCTKLWNIGKFTSMVVKEKPHQTNLHAVDLWILGKYSDTVEKVTELYENYQFDKAMREIEDFAWHEYADHYLEMIKHRTKNPDDGVLFTLYTVTLGIAKMFAPFLPHVTEDIYQDFKDMDGFKSIHVSEWPKPLELKDERENGDIVKEIISAVRSWKSENKIPLNQELKSIELIGPGATKLGEYAEDIRETSRALNLEMLHDAELEEEVCAIKPIKSKIGPAFKTQGKEILQILSSMDPQKAAESLKSGPLVLNMSDGSIVSIPNEFIELERKLMLMGQSVETIQIGDILIAISQ